MSIQREKMKDKKTETVNNWPEPKFVCDIEISLGFANFYWRFIQDFSKIAGPLISMLETSSSTGSSIIL